MGFLHSWNLMCDYTFSLREKYAKTIKSIITVYNAKCPHSMLQGRTQDNGDTIYVYRSVIYSICREYMKYRL